MISPFGRPKQSLAWNQQGQGKSFTHDAADDATNGAVVPDVLPSYLLRRRKPQRLYLRLLLRFGGFPGLSISVGHARSSPLDWWVETQTRATERARSLRDRQSQARRALHERYRLATMFKMTADSCRSPPGNAFPPTYIFLIDLPALLLRYSHGTQVIE